MAGPARHVWRRVVQGGNEKASDMRNDNQKRGEGSTGATCEGITRRAMMGSALAAGSAAVAPFAAEAAWVEHQGDWLP